MTFSALLPYLLVIGGYLLRHYDVASKLWSLLGGDNPLSPPSNHPIVSNAVNAAINEAVQDALAGHVTSLRDELKALVNAAVASAVANLKSKS